MFRLILFYSLLAHTPQLLSEQTMKLPIECETAQDWKIGGKIHFEEQSADNYIGTIEINKITRSIIKELMDVQLDSCADNAKVLLKKRKLPSDSFS